MHISDFEYDLPQELIAQEPLEARDASRLLVVDRARGEIQHREFHDLPRLLARGDRLVVNDTRVIPARVLGRRKGAAGTVELLLLNPIRGKEGKPTFEVLARPARKCVEGTVLLMGKSDVVVRVVGEIDDRKRLVEFPEDFPVLDFLGREGHIPLPPYIKREDTALDQERYQTIFARNPGAVAAPTAGLHFTEHVLRDLEAAGISRTPITLNVGAGTFSPILEEDPRNHDMEREYYRIPEPAAREITETRRGGGRVVAVGTTVVRALETAETPLGENDLWTVRAGDGWTEKFIYPPYEFHLVDALITNFHLPRSTLLMLVSAFGGLPLIRRAYQEAARASYRFYSYGDAMLIL